MSVSLDQTGDHGLAREDAERLARDPAARTFFEAAVTHHPNARRIAAWVLNEVRGELVRIESDGGEPTLSPAHVAALVRLVDEERISGKIAKEVLAEMLESGDPPGVIVERRGLEQISDPDTLIPIIDRVLSESTEQLAAYRAGKTALRGYFVGRVMKATGGRAKPELVQRLLTERLETAG